MKKLILPSLLAALCIAASPAPIYRNWSTTNLNPIVTSNQIADKTITGAKIADATITTNLLTASAYEALVGDVTAAGDNVFTGSNAFLGPVSGGEVSASNLTALYVTASNSVLAYGPVISRDGFEVKFPGGEQTAFIADTDGRVEAAGNLSVSNLMIAGPTASNQVFWLNNDGEALNIFGETGTTMLRVPYNEGWTIEARGNFAADSLAVGATGTNVIGDSGSRVSGVAMTNNWVYADGAKIGATGTNVIADGGSSINGVRMTNGWLWATDIITTNLIATNFVRAYGGTGDYVELSAGGYPLLYGSSALYLSTAGTTSYLLGQYFLRGRSSCRFEWSTNDAHQTPDLSIYRAGEGTLGVSNSVMVWSNVAIKASGDGVIDRTPVSGAAQFFAATNSGSGKMAEMYVQDEAGNETLISPHATDAPPELYDRAAGEVTDYIVREANPFVGTLHWVNIRRMARLTELNTMALLYLAGATNAANSNALARLKSMPASKRQVIASESYAQYNARTGAKLEVLDWNAVQDKNQAAYDAERARLAAERESALATNAVLTAEGRTNELMVVPDVPEAKNVRLPAPTWLQSRETIEKR